jgi:DNA invertase Pin-like site-specific DNA recombinase
VAFFLGGSLLSYFLVITSSAFLLGTLPSYSRATLPSYFVAFFLSTAIIQKDLRGFLSEAAELEYPEPSEKKEGIGVALYLRVSSNRQAEKGFSLQDQEERLMEEAKGKLKATRIYKIADAGESGTDFTRKGLNEILELAREGKIQHVLVTSLDRIGRDLIESLDYVRKLRSLGVKIMVAGTEADIATEEGLMMATIQFLSAELENRRRTKSSIAGRIQSFKSGRWGKPALWIPVSLFVIFFGLLLIWTTWNLPEHITTVSFVIGTTCIAISFHFFSVGNTVYSVGATLKDKSLLNVAYDITSSAILIVMGGILMISIGLLTLLASHIWMSILFKVMSVGGVILFWYGFFCQMKFSRWYKRVYKYAK